MDVVLTTRDSNKENPIPPGQHHTRRRYISEQVAGPGYKVAVCEQVEEAPRLPGWCAARSPGFSPWTVTDAEMLEESRNNYLCLHQLSPRRRKGLLRPGGSGCIHRRFSHHRMGRDEAAAALADELLRLQPAECIDSSGAAAKLFQPYLEQSGVSGTVFDYAARPEQVQALLSGQWGEALWEKLSLSRYPAAAAAAAAALSYLRMLQHPARGRHFRKLELTSPGGRMFVDGITARNLELTRTIRDGKKRGSLLGLLDHCLTAMGGGCCASGVSSR